MTPGQIRANNQQKKWDSDLESGFVNYKAIRMAFAKAVQKRYVIDRGKTPCEVVNEFEIYLLDEQGQREKRICGVQKRNYPVGYLCQAHAGQGTPHLHIGKCVKHEKTEVSTYRLLMQAIANRSQTDDPVVATQVTEVLGKFAIPPEQLSKLDGDIEAYYSLLGLVGNRNLIVLHGDNWIRVAKELIDSIVKAKRLRVEMEIESKYIAKTDFVVFYRQLMELAIKELGSTRGSLFIEKVKALAIGYEKEDMRRLTNASGITAAYANSATAM